MLVYELKSKSIKLFAVAPNNAQVKKTFAGENWSAIVKIANVNVPIINPNWTEEVRFPKAFSGKLYVFIKSSKTAFPANHKDVQQN